MSGSHVEGRTISSAASNDVLDMICVGFGPAGLTIAVALEDWLEEASASHSEHLHVPQRPKTLFLEKQSSFNWHAGMLLHSAKMQISFVKDLATVRNPSSRFTFLNYLKTHGRLSDFARFNTFLPSRLEFSDYLRWAAGYFEQCVRYGHEVLHVRPVHKGSRVIHFRVDARDCSIGQLVHFYAKQVVIAAGGSPMIPLPFRVRHPAILHSSQYETTIDRTLPDRLRPYRVAVVGSGQSAAEIFDDLATRFPNAYTTLIFRDSALRPSDDSPFVNEVFNPTAIDSFFQKTSNRRLRDIKRDRGTNYSVVRIELIEKIYGDLYLQDIEQPDPSQQRRRMLASTEVTQVQATTSSEHIEGDGSILLALKDLSSDKEAGTLDMSDHHHVAFDAVILATGYTRNAHLEILRECHSLGEHHAQTGPVTDALSPAWHVQRDYSLKLKRDLVQDGVGIWLQGCNEETHGLSDSLLSVLASRSGELVQSMFGTSHNNQRGHMESKVCREKQLRARL